MLFQTALQVLKQAIPDPAPSAPAEFAMEASTAISSVKWASLAVVMAVLSGAGFLILSENRGGSGMSGEIKSKLGQGVVVLIVVGWRPRSSSSCLDRCWQSGSTRLGVVGGLGFCGLGW